MSFGHNLRECRPIFKILSLTDSQEKKLYLWQKLLPVIYYVATLPCEIRCRYSEYFTFQHDEALSHRAWETIDLLKQTMPKLYSALSVAIQQSRSKSQRLCSVRNSAKPHLQEPCQRCRRAAAARQGETRLSWSASDGHCNQKMAQQTAGLHCSWQGTFLICTLNITHICWNVVVDHLRKKWWRHFSHKPYTLNFKFYKVVQQCSECEVEFSFTHTFEFSQESVVKRILTTGLHLH